MEQDAHIYEILMLKSLEQALTPEERQRLGQWLASSPANRQQYEQLKSVWNVTSPSSEVPEPNYDIAWQNIAMRTGLEEKTTVQTMRNRRERDGLGLTDRAQDRQPAHQIASRQSMMQRLGFAIPILVLFLVVVWLLVPRSESMVEAVAERGETRIVHLPDGSTVQLNSESVVRYPREFAAERRKITMTGEAVFTIQSAPVPFTVASGASEVTVLGTRFNVRTRNNQTQVAVEEGRVRFQSIADHSASIELGPNEGAMLVDGRQLVPLDERTAQNAFGWARGVIAFDRTTFSEATEELARIFNRTIVINAPELAERTVSGSIRTDEGAPQALETLCLTLGCDVAEDGSQITITP